MLIIKNMFVVKTDLEQDQVVTSYSDSSRVFSDVVPFINVCSMAYYRILRERTVQSLYRSISWER
jgi:hypothetical protein